MTIFERPEDYDAFLGVLEETWAVVPLPILALTVMPNHWHFVVRPEADEQVTEFFRRLTVTHTMRWHAYYRSGGTGHLYQGRFKSFPVQRDDHLLSVMRYVERNPLRARFVEQAEQWRWGSAWVRRQRDSALRKWLIEPLDPPLPRQCAPGQQAPGGVRAVRIRQCVRRGAPFGDDRWVQSSAERLGLANTLRPRGRPREKRPDPFCWSCA